MNYLYSLVFRPATKYLEKEIILCCSKEDVVLKNRFLGQPECSSLKPLEISLDTSSLHTYGNHNLVLLIVNRAKLEYCQHEVDVAKNIAGRNGKLIIIVCHFSKVEHYGQQAGIGYLDFEENVGATVEHIRIIKKAYHDVVATYSLDMTNVPEYFRPQVFQEEQACLIIWPKDLHVDILFHTVNRLTFTVNMDRKITLPDRNNEQAAVFRNAIKKHNKATSNAQSYLLNITPLAPKSVKSVEIDGSVGIMLTL